MIRDQVQPVQHLTRFVPPGCSLTICGERPMRDAPCRIGWPTKTPAGEPALWAVSPAGVSAARTHLRQGYGMGTGVTRPTVGDQAHGAAGHWITGAPGILRVLQAPSSIFQYFPAISRCLPITRGALPIMVGEINFIPGGAPQGRIGKRDDGGWRMAGNVD